MALVELNRLRSIREAAEGKLEVLMFELRNLIGLKPEETLRLRGDFSNLIDQLPPLAYVTDRALFDRRRRAVLPRHPRHPGGTSAWQCGASVGGNRPRQRAVRISAQLPVSLCSGLTTTVAATTGQDVFHFLKFGGVAGSSGTEQESGRSGSRFRRI
jgi:hypothetical protein